MVDLTEYYSKKFNEGFWQFIIDNPYRKWTWAKVLINYLKI